MNTLVGLVVKMYFFFPKQVKVNAIFQFAYLKKSNENVKTIIEIPQLI